MSLPKGTVYHPMNQFDIMKTPFLMFQSHRDDYYDMSRESLRGITEESIVSKLFFSPKNVDIVQKRIITEVFRRTNGAYLIEKQNEEDLQVIMRSMYIQHVRNKYGHLKEQIEELNNIVVDDIVPNVISEINAYIGYLERAFAPRQILDHPQNVSIIGTKTIPSVTRTWDTANEIQTYQYKNY